MKPISFDYEQPRTVAEVLALLSQPGRSAMPLAGGQSLVPQLNRRQARPDVVVDLNRIPELEQIVYACNSIRVGAMVRLVALERDASLRQTLPILGQVAAAVAYPQIRTRTTVGGSLCHADPAAELPTALLALDAQVHILSSTGVRVLRCDDFIRGPHRTAVGAGEIVVAVEIARRGDMRFEFAEVSRGAAGPPLVTACCGLSLVDGVVVDARVTASGVAERPIRLRLTEAALAGWRVGDDGQLAAVAYGAAAEADPPSDEHGSAAYRRALLRMVLTRAISRFDSGRVA